MDHERHNENEDSAMNRSQPPTTEALQQALREHCRQQAEKLYERLGEAVASLRDGNHLGALGALDGVERRTLELSVALKLIHDLSYRKES